MDNTYTKLVKEPFFSQPELELMRISTSVKSAPLDTDEQAWLDKLEDIAQQFRLSCRFCLMRIFQARAKVHKQLTENGFRLKLDEKEYVFEDISIDHAASMTESESGTYLAYMMALAAKQTHPETWPELKLPELKECTPAEYEERLILKAWAHRQPNQDPLVLTRKEAFRLGHMLAFNQEEMKSFLLRVFDYEEGFRFDTSNDLIEAYGLKMQKSWLAVEALKQDYAKRTAGQTKQEPENRNQNWTSTNVAALTKPYKSDQEFLGWMEERSSGLDTGSRTARRIYRNLAAFCFHLNDNPYTTDNIKDLLKETNETKLAQELIFDNGVPSEKKCQALASALLTINWEQAQGYSQTKQKSWSVPTLTDRKSKLSKNHGPFNLSKRAKKLLLGSIQVEKSDLIFLLWVISNQVWKKTASTAKEITLRVQRFIHLCDEFLKEAMLPPFYVPHLLERSMLLAIVRNSDQSYDSSPAVEYEWILNLEKQIQEEKVAAKRKCYKGNKENVNIRNKKSGYKRHSEKEWKDLVIEAQTEKLEYTMEEFAELRGISVSRLNQYQSEFVKRGELGPFDRKKAHHEYMKQLEAKGEKEAVLQAKAEALAAVRLKKKKLAEKKARAIRKMRKQVDAERELYLKVHPEHK